MTGRIFITGDKHGAFLPIFGLAEKVELRDTDILIIAGDAGYVWNDSYPYAVETLHQTFPGIIAFIDGNHENHALLNSMEVKEWCGGKIHEVGARMYHMMRGEMYSIYGNHIFNFGGARSNDIDRRKEGESWWKEEEPTLTEMEYGRNQILKHINIIDYVITHETPLFAREHISRSKQIDEDYFLLEVLDDWYRLLSDAPNFKKWYFGHMHIDQPITHKLRAIYNDILLLGEEEKKMPWF